MFHFLSISNLNTSKGTFVLLDAAALLLQKTTDYHVHFVGAPTAEISAERMLQEIEKRGLREVVTYHGKQYGEDKEQRFAEADCFVHPTLDDCFPLVILEAMQHSLPVIATPVGAIPDMVIDGETGIIVSVQDVEILAETMNRLTKNKKLREMCISGKKRVETLFSEDNIINHLVEILSENV